MRVAVVSVALLAQVAAQGCKFQKQGSKEVCKGCSGQCSAALKGIKGTPGAETACTQFCDAQCKYCKDVPTAAPTAGWASTPGTTPTEAPSLAPAANVPPAPPAPPPEPSRSPAAAPSLWPSVEPSLRPTATPAMQPTVAPSPAVAPSQRPSVGPSAGPSAAPSVAPSAAPSVSPTVAPSLPPSAAPSGRPSAAPSARPSAAPTNSPSAAPSAAPSSAPTSAPQPPPTAAPTGSPTTTPSAAPSVPPTSEPTRTPLTGPTRAPSTAPSASPTARPSPMPSAGPSSTPTTGPTDGPTGVPTVAPSGRPSTAPSASPSASPLEGPTWGPTATPTTAPSAEPSTAPSLSPSRIPTDVPTRRPSAQPSVAPSVQPSTAAPTDLPSTGPTRAPLMSPSRAPSAAPTAAPAASPTTTPATAPSVQPSSAPSLTPSAGPAPAPTAAPSATPSAAPSAKPAAAPTSAPRTAPTSAAPSARPSVGPMRPTPSPAARTATPARQPTAAPSTLPPTPAPAAPPTLRPTAAPSTLPPTAAPATAPPTRAPTLSSALPTARPTRGPASAPTSPPAPAKSPLEAASGGAVDVAKGLAGAAGPAGASVLITMSLSACKVEDLDLDSAEPLDWELHPVGLFLDGGGMGSHKQRYFVGCVVWNQVIIVLPTAALFLVASARHTLRTLQKKSPQPFQKSLALVRCPGFAFAPLLFLTGGTTLSAAHLAFFPSVGPPGGVVLGWIVMVLCAVFPFVIWRTMLRAQAFHAEVVPDPRLTEENSKLSGLTREAYKFLFGSHVYVSTHEYFVECVGLCFESYSQGKQWWLIPEIGQLAVLSFFASWVTDNKVQCTVRNSLVTLMFGGYLVGIFLCKPFMSPFETIVQIVLSSCNTGAMLLMTTALALGDSAPGGLWTVAILLLAVAAFAQFVLFVITVLQYVHNTTMQKARRAFTLGRNALDFSQHLGRGLGQVKSGLTHGLEIGGGLLQRRRRQRSDGVTPVEVLPLNCADDQPKAEVEMSPLTRHSSSSSTTRAPTGGSARDPLLLSTRETLHRRLSSRISPRQAAPPKNHSVVADAYVNMYLEQVQRARTRQRSTPQLSPVLRVSPPNSPGSRLRGSEAELSSLTLDNSAPKLRVRRVSSHYDVPPPAAVAAAAAARPTKATTSPTDPDVASASDGDDFPVHSPLGRVLVSGGGRGVTPANSELRSGSSGVRVVSPGSRPVPPPMSPPRRRSRAPGSDSPRAGSSLPSLLALPSPTWNERRGSGGGGRGIGAVRLTPVDDFDP
eukprot:TRINITY_DN2429_c0_g1_i1.p1 TRINITY_DN2429_c0_g1~~TRINITY_DN2429_c0_g1_i1.p1  ORF type:complete len:1281 (+),score=262.48 TRINITY_DN2429_c0_g1_i1:53-3844(+)